jgi:hypothetical protein
MEKFTNLADFITKRGVPGRQLPEFPVLLFSPEHSVFILTCEENMRKLSSTGYNEPYRMGYHYDRFNFTDKEIVEIQGILYLISFQTFSMHGNLTLTVV